MPSQHCQPDKTPVVWNVEIFANRQNQQKRGPSGNAQLPPPKRRVSAPAGERYSSQRGSSKASTNQGQNTSRSLLLNISRLLDITEWKTSTSSAAQWRSINTPIAMPGTSSCSTAAPWGTSHTAATRLVVSSPTSGIASTPTSLWGLDRLHTHIPNPEGCAIVTTLLQMRATERNQRQRQWQFQLQAVTTPQTLVSGSCIIHRFCHSDVTGLVIPTGILLELSMWNRWPFINTNNLEMARYAMRCVVKALAEAPHRQIIEMYWITTMLHNNNWSIEFEACTKEILEEVCWRNGPHWILHTQTGTRFKHKSIRLNSILLNWHGTKQQNNITSTGLKRMQSIWNSSIPFRQTLSIFSCGTVCGRWCMRSKSNAERVERC